MHIVQVKVKKALILKDKDTDKYWAAMGPTNLTIDDVKREQKLVSVTISTLQLLGFTCHARGLYVTVNECAVTIFPPNMERYFFIIYIYYYII